MKTEFKFFTIADAEKEENYLREMHKKGYKLKKFILPCTYIFEECQPMDTVYKLDFNPNKVCDDDYIQMYSDYGWEYMFTANGFNYFRKSVADVQSEQELEIFSDITSKYEMVSRIWKMRFIPILLLLICSGILVGLDLYRKVVLGIGDIWDMIILIIYAGVIILAIIIISYVFLNLSKLKKKCNINE